MKLSEKIIRLRKGRGLSQEELAERLGVSRQAVSRWESGTALPDAGNLRQISRLFEVSADYLLDEERESPEGPAAAAAQKPHRTNTFREFPLAVKINKVHRFIYDIFIFVFFH